MSSSKTTPNNRSKTTPPFPASLRRRSLRLASVDDGFSSPTAIRVFNQSNPTLSESTVTKNVDGIGVLNLRSGKNVLKRGMDQRNTVTKSCDEEEIGNEDFEKDDLVVNVVEVRLGSEFEINKSVTEECDNSKRGKRKLSGDVSGNVSEGSSRSRSRRRLSREEKGKVVVVDGDFEDVVVGGGEGELSQESEMKDLNLNCIEDNVALQDREELRNFDCKNSKENGSRKSGRRNLSKEEKGEAVMVGDNLSGDVEVELGVESEIKDSEDNVDLPDREGSMNFDCNSMERGSRRSGRRSLSKEEKGKVVMVDGDLSGDVEVELGIESEIKDSEDNVDPPDRGGSRNFDCNTKELGSRRSGRRGLSKEEKGKAVMVDGDLSGDVGEGELGIEFEIKDLEDNVDLPDREGLRNFDCNTKENGSRRRSRRGLSKEEKSKAVMVDGDLSGDVGEGGSGIEYEIKDLDVNRSEDNADLPDRELSNTRDHGSRRNVNTNAREHGSRRERFRDIARENASRFAYFNLDGRDENRPSPERPEVEPEIEDWPGPFSTAMKIIKDRMVKSVQPGGVSAERSLVDSIKWVPKTDKGNIGSSFSVPPLHELCLKILVKNVDAIASLDSVPDALRHKLSQLLCDSRKLNGHFFELLVSGSPTEIRLRDCSWLTEEQFATSFQMSDTANLVVLQLDQCGRCLPDYVVLATLAQSPRHLPRLTSLSLSGACRLSDGGLRALVSSAPALRSINLSLCSLLTSSSVYILAESLKSMLKELYLDDCQGIDAGLIVPALIELEQLEVLSMAGIQTVGDEFVRDYIIARGHNLKELVLKDCINLTDSSVKVIAEHCLGLCVLDLTNLCKLTDLSMGYLTNGCRALHTLKLCRNPFSDEAIAAFLETNGESLKELSLNNIKKVGYHSTLSLANHAKSLHTLDLSWCRNLTDNALGLIVDSCLSLRLLKLFGCTQVTDVFVNGHSNLHIQIIGLKMSQVLQHVKVPNPHQAALNYSSVSLNLA
ncbi:hypothetical protein Lal_00021903 [Lupinus albus]|uniref:Putative leucine-rich repeat domain, L domain-containing protein n=1 Tax=Lupinus albus TaxID=3870 RepID=A0A6A5LYN7_LUPAL|nr:putative leucine-rich repeat domain, L domain-containing protein [Lupinus albus]KAF1864480.1 hypothetical protein Lal_00021903 [Lupinus albus]